jgi:hypothetical protein
MIMRENESPNQTEENEAHTQKNNVNNNKNAKSKQGIPTKGMRVGYHSEAANIDTDNEKTDGMRIGYHSEVANIGTDNEKTDGMRVGYHSEAANPSGHSRRLHRKEKNKK